MGSDVHLVHLVPLVLLVRHRIRVRWILCPGVEDVKEVGVSTGEVVEDGGGPGHVVADPTAPHGAQGVPGLPELQWCQYVRPPSDTACIMLTRSF